MVPGGGSGTAAGGFAARALRREDAGGGARGAFDVQAPPGKAVGAKCFRSTPDDTVRPVPPRASVQAARDPQRVKRLAAVAAASAAVALVSVSYGVWAAASAHAAVDEATAGAAPTLVAAADIKAGSVVSAAQMEVQSIPRSFRAQAALDESALAEGGAVAGHRALVDIPAGSQITASLMTGTEGGGLAGELKPGMEAVSLSVDTETGIAGQVRAYDTVRVVSVESGSSGASLLDTLCERARVLAVGEGASGEGSGYASVTVEVSPAQADAVREAQFAGRVSLLLVSASDAIEEGDGRG